MRSRWGRSVSFQDELFDRWERATFLGFGKGSSIYQDSLVLGDIKVGEDTWIGPFTVLDGSGGLSIGNNCSISSGVQIYSHDTVKRRLSDGKIPPERAPTSIGDSCYIGPLSIVTKGVTVSHHSVVGALSLVNADVEPMTVVYGTPAKVMGRVSFSDEGDPQFEWFSDEGDYSSRTMEELRLRIDGLEAKISKLQRAR